MMKAIDLLEFSLIPLKVSLRSIIQTMKNNQRKRKYKQMGLKIMENTANSSLEECIIKTLTR